MIRLYWWRGKGFTNFGDELSPWLIRRFADVEVTRTGAADPDVISTGSILDHVTWNWSGHVLGSGSLFDRPAVPAAAKVWALRGPLSAQGYRGDYVLGDPGLLAADWVPAAKKEHDLGLLPHWSDRELFRRPEFLRYDPLLINPTHHPVDVLRAISSCRKLVTSSLHGLIVADSYGIPRRFEPAPQLEHEGGFFKHRDFHASIGHPFEVGKTTAPSRFLIDDRRNALLDAFEAFGRAVRV